MQRRTLARRYGLAFSAVIVALLLAVLLLAGSGDNTDRQDERMIRGLTRVADLPILRVLFFLARMRSWRAYLPIDGRVYSRHQQRSERG